MRPFAYLTRGGAIFGALATLLLLIPAARGQALLSAAKSAGGHGPAPPALSGRVVDAKNGEPLVDAHLRIVGRALLEVADERGRFQIYDLPPGELTITASHLGYRGATRTLRLAEGERRSLQLALEPLRLPLEPVELRLSQPGSAYRIEGSELRARGATSVGEAVAALPGVQLLSEGGEGAPARISLRGGRPEHVRVLVDGTLLTGDDGAGVDLGRIPAGQIASIEVEPTPGPGAPGGQVLITTRSHTGEAGPAWQVRSELSPGPRGGQIAVSAEAVGGLRLHAQLLGSEGDFAYRDEEGRWQERRNNERRRWSAGLVQQTRLGGGYSLRGALTVDGGRFGQPGALYVAPTPQAWRSERGLRGELELERALPEQRSWSGRLALQGRDRRYRNPREQYHPDLGQLVLHTPVDQRDHSRHGELSLATTAPRRKEGLHLDAEVGAGLESYRAVNELADGHLVARVEQVQRRSLHLQGRAGLMEKAAGWSWRPSLLLRATGYEDDGAEATRRELLPSGRAVLHARPLGADWGLHLAAGSGAEPPSFTSRFLSESVFAAGNVELLPERISELSAGLSARTGVGAARLTLSATGWLRRTEQLIVWQRSWQGRYRPDNGGDAVGRGIELGVEAGAGPLESLGGAVTLQRIRLDDPGSAFHGNRIPFQADLYGSAHARFALPLALRLGVQARFSGRRYTSLSNLDPYSTSGDGLAPYAVVDLLLSRSFAPASTMALDLGVGVDNLFERDYELLERMVMPGRSWRLRLEIRGVER